MLFVQLLDDSFETITAEHGIITEIPKEATNIKILLCDTHELNEVAHLVEYEDLIEMVRCSKRKFHSITMEGHHEMRLPDYLALLTSVTQNTYKLELTDSADEDFVCDIGYSCLMSGLMMQDGLKTLSLSIETVSAYQAELLFQGVAYSTCLESLEIIHLIFEDHEAARNSFVNALNKNQSLEALNINYTNLVHYEEIFRAAVLEAKIRSFMIGTEPEDSRLGLGVALDVLSSQACHLQSVEISDADMMIDDLPDGPAKINTTVSNVDLMGVQLESSHLSTICASFKSMTRLNLNFNNIDGLSPLDTLLIGDNRKLQKLSLGYNNICENSVIEFFRKLPEMRYIRSIELDGNPFLHSREWYDVLSDAIRHNASLECLLITQSEEDDLVELYPFLAKIEVALSLNRAWRRHMENDTGENTTGTSLPPTLWPKVLERATNISYFGASNISYSGACPRPTNNSLKTDAVFWLLRQRMVGEVPFGS